MRKAILTITFLFTVISVSAQFYISAGGGYSFGVGKKELDEPKGSIKSSKGSYGEGINAQLRFGYFFTEKIGAELGVGYLHGSDQQAFDLPAVNAKARARVFGASLTAVYNITENFYAKAGLLTKLGGKTEGLITAKEDLSGTPAPSGTTLLPQGTYLEINAKQEARGKFPLGFIAAVGYKHPITDNMSLFAELDYMGISVDADKAKLVSYTAKLHTPDGQARTIQTIDSIEHTEIVFVDNPKPGTNQRKTYKAPYSSIGINIGVTYSF